jgi:DNA-binding MarR family transcriptional regulator
LTRFKIKIPRQNKLIMPCVGASCTPSELRQGSVESGTFTKDDVTVRGRLITVSDTEGDIDSLAAAVRRLVHGWVRFQQVIAAELHIGISEVVALGHITDLGVVTPHDLAELMHLTSGSVTALLARLEAAAFVGRVQNPGDRRSVLISARPAGRHAAGWMQDQSSKPIIEALAGSGTPRAQELIPAFEAITRGLVAQAIRLSAQARHG